MSRINFDTLLEATCHDESSKRKWNPAMAPYIFMERNGIHIIDLHKTVAKVDEAAEALKQIAKSGKKVLFVATKKQAKQVVADKASAVNMPYVIERWPGGMLTNFPTIRKAVHETFDIVSDEARAKYHDFQRKGERDGYKGLTFWTPNINIYRDPRWGRGMETYGEDPYLTSLMGLAVVKGLQGGGTGKYDKAHACAKHYAVHSGPEWNRHSFDAKNISHCPFKTGYRHTSPPSPFLPSPKF